MVEMPVSNAPHVVEVVLGALILAGIVSLIFLHLDESKEEKL
jgi:hypothetical protein